MVSISGLDKCSKNSILFSFVWLVFCVGIGFGRLPWFSGFYECAFFQKPVAILSELQQIETIEQFYSLKQNSLTLQKELALFCRDHNLYFPLSSQFFEKNWVFAWYTPAATPIDFALDNYTHMDWFFALIRDVMSKGVFVIEAFPGAIQWMTELYGNEIVFAKNGDYLLFSAFPNLLQLGIDRLMYRDDFSKNTLFFQEKTDSIVEVKNAYKFLQTEIKSEVSYSPLYLPLDEKEISSFLSTNVFLQGISTVDFLNKVAFAEKAKEWFIISSGQKSWSVFLTAVSTLASLIVLQSNAQGWILSVVFSKQPEAIVSVLQSWGVKTESAPPTSLRNIVLFADTLFLSMDVRSVHLHNREITVVSSLAAVLREELQRLISDKAIYEIGIDILKKNQYELRKIISRRFENDLSVETQRLF